MRTANIWEVMVDDLAVVALVLGSLNSKAYRIYEFLWTNRNESDGSYRHGRESIRKRVQCGPNTLSKALLTLRTLGLLDVTEVDRRGKQSITVIPYFQSKLFKIVEVKEHNVTAIREFVFDLLKDAGDFCVTDESTCYPGIDRKTEW